MTQYGRQARFYYRHRLPVRIMHWINVVALTILFMSGLQIFNAHPALYWGKSSYDGTPPLLEIGAQAAPDGKPHRRARAISAQRVRHDRRARRCRRDANGELTRARLPVVG